MIKIVYKNLFGGLNITDKGRIIYKTLLLQPLNSALFTT